MERPWEVCPIDELGQNTGQLERNSYILEKGLEGMENTVYVSERRKNNRIVVTGIRFDEHGYLITKPQL
jgi:hypothetical protein